MNNDPRNEDGRCRECGRHLSIHPRTPRTGQCIALPCGLFRQDQSVRHPRAPVALPLITMEVWHDD